LIFQNDLSECISETQQLFSTDDLLIKDLNGDTAIDYILIYNAERCFDLICDNYSTIVSDIYKYLKQSGTGFIEKSIT
jgi:hypothetical protein